MTWDDVLRLMVCTICIYLGNLVVALLFGWPSMSYTEILVMSCTVITISAIREQKK